MKLIRYLWPILMLALAALACRATERAFDSSPQTIVTGDPIPVEQYTPTLYSGTPEGIIIETSTASGEGGISPLPEPTETTARNTPAPAGKPPQSQAAEIRPAELRPELTRLSALIGLQVLDREGASLGTISDFIVNTCETYILYFLLDTTGGAAGSRIVIPFELVTINSGVFDAQARTVQLSLAGTQFIDAPAFAGSQELIPVDWEAGVREYWSRIARISNLTSGCRVSLPEWGATEVHKVAHASELLGVTLRDGLGNPLGRVEEAILAPESGKLSFFVVNLDGDAGLVLAPLRVVNIPKEAMAPGGELSLVLLVENGVLFGAPRINSLEEAVLGKVQSSARAYWNR